MAYKRKSKLVYGVGVNDAPYSVYKTEHIHGKQVNTWICPYYLKWCDMLKRCYSEKHLDTSPTYSGYTVTEDWKYLSNFIKWVDSQPNKDWQSCHLDKDLLQKDKKQYSPDTCVFISQTVNNFINIKTDLNVGCRLLKDGITYEVKCRDPLKIHKEYVGIFKTLEDAKNAYNCRKRFYAECLARVQPDPRVSEILLKII